MVAEVLKTNTVLDISVQPGLWGGLMRGTEAKLMASSDPHLDRASSVSHAGMFVEGEVIQFLSAIGREHLDYYAVCPSSLLSESQIEGMNLSVADLRENGHIRKFGLDARRLTQEKRVAWVQAGRFDFILESFAEAITQIDGIQWVCSCTPDQLPQRTEIDDTRLVAVNSVQEIHALEPWLREVAIG